MIGAVAYRAARIGASHVSPRPARKPRRDRTAAPARGRLASGRRMTYARPSLRLIASTSAVAFM